MADADAVAPAVLAEAGRQLDEAVVRIKHCLDQLSDEQLWWRPQPEMNSIANLVLHLCGNVGQWIVCGMGGSPDTRDRPAEFAAQGGLSRDELCRRLDGAVQQAKTVLESVTAEQLLEPIRVQGFETTRLPAMFDSITHFRGHTQEIMALTRMQLRDRYRFHWAPTTPEQGAPA